MYHTDRFSVLLYGLMRTTDADGCSLSCLILQCMKCFILSLIDGACGYYLMDKKTKQATEIFELAIQNSAKYQTYTLLEVLLRILSALLPLFSSLSCISSLPLSSLSLSFLPLLVLPPSPAHMLIIIITLCWLSFH